MFWFAIGLGGIAFVYGVLALINHTRTHWRTVLVCRLVYILMRFLNLACIFPPTPFLFFYFSILFFSLLVLFILTFTYMGLMMTCSYTIVAAPHNYRTIIPAIFTLVLLS
jgi:hypothetical protein